MSDNNKRNLHYFEATSMKGLYESLEAWQAEEQKRFLSVSIERDGDSFCCIALTNPSEVIIMGAKDGSGGATVYDGKLYVESY